jgi:hypothetical protein
MHRPSSNGRVMLAGRLKSTGSFFVRHVALRRQTDLRRYLSKGRLGGRLFVET